MMTFDQFISLNDIFLSQLSNLVGVLDENEYKGGQFCSGIIFGCYGARMLTKVAEKA